MHGWYEVVFYLENDSERKLGCWLGPAEEYGDGDAAFLLPRSAHPIVRRTFLALTPEERADRKEEIDGLLNSIEEKKIGDKRSNEEVANELGPNQSPLVDIFGD